MTLVKQKCHRVSAPPTQSPVYRATRSAEAALGNSVPCYRTTGHRTKGGWLHAPNAFVVMDPKQPFRRVMVTEEGALGGGGRGRCTMHLLQGFIRQNRSFPTSTWKARTIPPDLDSAALLSAPRHWHTPLRASKQADQRALKVV